MISPPEGAGSWAVFRSHDFFIFSIAFPLDGGYFRVVKGQSGWTVWQGCHPTPPTGLNSRPTACLKPPSKRLLWRKVKKYSEDPGIHAAPSPPFPSAPSLPSLLRPPPP